MSDIDYPSEPTKRYVFERKRRQLLEEADKLPFKEKQKFYKLLSKIHLNYV